MLKIKVPEVIFGVPRLVFTLRGNVKSERIINALQTAGSDEQEYAIFESLEDIRGRFQQGISPSAAVVIFDDSHPEPGRGWYFTMMTSARSDDAKCMPSWSSGAQWGVMIRSARNADGCAMQLRADFLRNFAARINGGWFPWGKPRKKDVSPMARVELPEGTDDLIARLNNGPDFAVAIANAGYALELPAGSRISWIRVAPEPIICDSAYLRQILSALRMFEEASVKVLRANPEMRKLLLAGVDLQTPELEELYLNPPVNSWSVDRADLHYTGSGLFASEIDEMPGGFVDAYHLDTSYGLNVKKWERCFSWLRRDDCSILLFLVSHEWSKVYVNEFRWLVDRLNHFSAQHGHAPAAAIRMTDELDDLEIRTYGVFLRDRSVDTIWRQFPVFETSGKLTGLVRAARQNLVRLVPEFGHFGNKVWFSLFRKYAKDFRRELPADVFAVLDEILPDSNLVLSKDSFPCEVIGENIASLNALRTLPENRRDKLVLKVCGANTLSARSYGVLMGHGLSQETWIRWIDERLRLKQPFIVQQKVGTGTANLLVKNTSRDLPELFSCRILLRPWVVGGKIVSVTACAVPASTLKVHGRVDMALLPVIFGE